MKWLPVLGALLVAALAAASPAAANPPTVQTRHFESSGVETWTCGFPITSSYSVDITETTHLDAAGTPVRSETRNRADGTWVGPTGLTAFSNQDMQSSIDLLTDVQTVTGTTVHVVAPGVGVLIHDVGRLVLAPGPISSPPTVLSESGQHPTLLPDLWAPLCEYLAGP